MSGERTLTARERLRIHLREARRTTDSPIVEAQLTAALDAWNDLPPTPLRCPVRLGKSDSQSGFSNMIVIEQYYLVDILLELWLPPR